MQIIDLPPGPRAAIEEALGRKLLRLRAYGNLRLLESPAMYVNHNALRAGPDDAETLKQIEVDTEAAILAGKVVVTTLGGVCAARAAVVSLRWGAPRILVLSCGIRKALGKDLTNEPLLCCRLWRYQFDPQTDLVLSTRTDDSGFLAFDECSSKLALAVADAFTDPLSDPSNDLQSQLTDPG